MNDIPLAARASRLFVARLESEARNLHFDSQCERRGCNFDTDHRNRTNFLNATRIIDSLLRVTSWSRQKEGSRFWERAFAGGDDGRRWLRVSDTHKYGRSKPMGKNDSHESRKPGNGEPLSVVHLAGSHASSHCELDVARGKENL